MVNRHGLPNNICLFLVIFWLCFPDKIEHFNQKAAIQSEPRLSKVKTRRPKYLQKFIQTRVAYVLFACMDQTPAGSTKESSIYSCKHSITRVGQWLVTHTLYKGMKKGNVNICPSMNTISVSTETTRGEPLRFLVPAVDHTHQTAPEPKNLT